MKKRFNWKHIYKQYGTQITMAAVLIVLCIALTIASPFFLKKSNILNIFVSFSVSGTMAAGLTVVMLMGCMDLSQYAVMALVGMVVALSLQAGLNAWLAILLGVILGTGIGAINAFIVTKMHIVPMIATISTQLMCRAGAYLVNNGQYVRVTDKLFDTIGFGRLFGINYLVYIVLIVFLIIGYVLKDMVLKELSEDKFETRLSHLMRPILSFNEDDSVYQIWEKMLEKREHISIILDEYGCLRGVVTMEDVIETMTGVEIVDEDDVAVDMQAFAKEKSRRMAAKTKQQETESQVQNREQAER